MLSADVSCGLVCQLLELAIGAESSQAIFSKDSRNRIAGFSHLFADLQPQSCASVGLMYFLEWNGQEQAPGILNFALVDQKLHPSLDDPFVLQRAYFIEPLLTFSKRLRP